MTAGLLLAVFALSAASPSEEDGPPRHTPRAAHELNGAERAALGIAAGGAIGAVSGAGLMLGFAGAILLSCRTEGCEPAGFAILGAPEGALVGGVIGAGVGAAVGLYLSPTP